MRATKGQLAYPVFAVSLSILPMMLHAQETERLEQGFEETSCLVKPGREATLSSHSPGVIEEMLVKPGEDVQEGDRLFTLKRDVERSSLTLERERVNYASRALKRNERLIEQGMLSDSERDEIVTELRLAQRQAALAEARLEDRVARAPFSGRIISLEAEEGEYIDATPVMSLAQLDPLRIELVLPVADYGRVSEGDMLVVALESPVDDEIEARVEWVDSVIDATSGTFLVEMRFSNLNSSVPAGINCRLP